MLSPNITIFGLPPDNTKWSKRPEAVEEIYEMVNFVAAELTDVIELPKHVKVKFSDTKNYYAQAFRRELFISPVSMELLDEDGDSEDVFKGIVAHEFSHLSDFATANPTRNTWLSKSRIVVGEGKGDHVGEMVGGINFADRLQGAIPAEKKRECYDELLLCERLPHAIKRWSERRIHPSEMSLVHQKKGSYAAGYALVNDVVAWTGSSSVVELHAQPHSFFMDVLRDNIGSV